MIGIDIIAIARMKAFMERFGEKALQRFLNEEEIALVRHPKTAAGFWAAKEAFSKALGTGISKDLGFHDMQIVKDARGAPGMSISEDIKLKYGIDKTALSISHDGGFAVAAAIIVFRQ